MIVAHFDETLYLPESKTLILTSLYTSGSAYNSIVPKISSGIMVVFRATT